MIFVSIIPTERRVEQCTRRKCTTQSLPPLVPNTRTTCLGFLARRYWVHLINVSLRALQLGCQSNDGTSANGHNLPNSDILCACSIFISEINLESNLVELLSSLYRANRGGEMMFFYSGSDRVFRNLHKLYTIWPLHLRDITLCSVCFMTFMDSSQANFVLANFE